MNTNKKLKIFTVLLLFLSAFSLHCKKAKELIEVTEKKEKSNKPHKNTVVAQSNAQQKSTPSKASECIKVPVVVAQNDPKKISEKPDPSIKVTHLDAKKEEKKSPRTIDVCNGITKNMITYHYLGERVPTQFSVSFNNHPVIKLQDEKICTLDTSSIAMNQDDTLQVTFSYQFDVKGIVYHKGTKEITYKVPTNLKEITPTFDWKKPEKVIIAQAELVTFRDI